MEAKEAKLPNNNDNVVCEQGPPADSFRGNVERRLDALESGSGGDTAAGLIRTYEARIKQMETLVSENTSQLLKVTELFTTQVANLTKRVETLEPKP